MKRTQQKTDRPAAIELLESRIAPAGVITITGGKVATWTDVDGDKVTLSISKGTLTAALFDPDQTPATGLLVKQLDLNNAIFAGTNLTVTATRDPLAGGDGTVNIGYINAAGQPLGKVTINGDLGRIDAGTPNPVAKTPKAIGSLSVFSMGMLDGETLPAGVIQTSEITGKIGAVKVRGSVEGVQFNVTGGTLGSIDSFFIGGSLIGTDDADSGRISASGAIGTVQINGSIFGSAGQHSGSIEAGGSIKAVKINGSIFGGRSDTPSTDGTGVVRSEQNIGAVTILGSIHGGTQQDSGLISAAGNIGAVKILGGIIGGEAGKSSGGIFVGGNAASISVRGDVLGGAALDSGVIHVAGKAGAISLLGSLTGGAGEGSGVVQLGTDAADVVASVTVLRDITGGGGDGSGAVHVAGKLGGLKIGASIHGGDGEASGLVSLVAGAKSALVLGDIAGATGEDSGRLVANAAVGSVTLGGNLLGGTADGAGAIVLSGKLDKLAITGSVIGGNLAGTAAGDLTGSGLIQAARIGALSIGGSIRVGEDHSAAFDLINNAAIRVQDDIGTLAIKGGIDGTEETAAIITARGQKTVVQDATTDVAIGKITIGNSVRNALILAGYDTTADVTAAASNPNAQIGDVQIAGDWIASDLVAGAAWNDNFGFGDTKTLANADIPGIVARIANISVKGQVVGTGDVAGDRFGFVAQEIVSMKIGPASNVILLNALGGNDNDGVLLRYNLSGTNDVRVFEFA